MKLPAPLPSPTRIRAIGAAVALGLAGLSPSSVDAQGPPPPPPPPPRAERDDDRPPPPPPRPDRLFSALDRDGDGRISAEEIARAPESLKGLDRDRDGSLGRDELFPPRPPREGRRGAGPSPESQAPPPPAPASVRTATGEEKVALAIRGGHEVDPRDHGRPVVLVAGALGVTPEVFRDAFSRVTPAPAGTEPHPDLARRNKAALLAALGPHGITNEQIDRASDRYRYVPGRGETWPTRAAAGHALLKDGVLVSVVVTDPGFGYSSSPSLAVPGHPELALEAKLAYGRDLEKNGSVASIAPPRAEVGPR